MEDPRSSRPAKMRGLSTSERGQSEEDCESVHTPQTWSGSCTRTGCPSPASAATRHAPPRRGRRRPIAREHNITFGEFHRKYLATSTPVIVSGSMVHGHISHAELVELCGERPLRHRCDNESATVRYRHESAAEGWGGMRLLRGLEGSAVFRNLSQLIAAQQDERWSMRVEADPNDLSSRPVDQLRDTASTGQHTVLGPQLYLHDTRISTLCPALLERVRPPRCFPVDQLRQLAGADFDKDDCRAYEYRSRGACHAASSRL